jgi:multidrug resistance efflux pump
MSDTRKISSFKRLLQGVPVTEPNVESMHSWDQFANAIRKAQNYLVSAQAEEARAETALEEAREEREDAEKMLDEAKAIWTQRSIDLLGVKVET